VFHYNAPNPFLPAVSNFKRLSKAQASPLFENCESDPLLIFKIAMKQTTFLVPHMARNVVPEGAPATRFEEFA